MEADADRVARIEHWLILVRDMMIDLAKCDGRQGVLWPLLRPGSKKRRKRLSITDCELMHRREAGELAFERRSIAYFYRFPANDAALPDTDRQH